MQLALKHFLAYVLSPIAAPAGSIPIYVGRQSDRLGFRVKNGGYTGRGAIGLTIDLHKSVTEVGRWELPNTS